MCRLALAVSFVVAVGAGGCGGGKGTPGEVATDVEFMTDVKLLLESYQKAAKKAPARVADLEPYEPSNPGGYMKLVRGEVVYAWGVPISAAGTRVLAYKKDAAEAGGSVLMEDGTVKQLTAAEFAAAPKAKK